MSECTLWTGYHEKNGYGRLTRDGRTQWVHRWAYEQYIGPIPDGYEVDHLCRVRLCEAVTPTENKRRALAAHSAFNPETHCRAGHRYTVENTYHRANGNGRSCRKCQSERARVRRARKAIAA